MVLAGLKGIVTLAPQIMWHTLYRREIAGYAQLCGMYQDALGPPVSHLSM